jgi:tRNA A-37 threonylcarbamoyl transferase component Bud32
MRAGRAPPGFVAEESADAITLVRSDLADAARALGLFAGDGIARALAAGAKLAGGRGAAARLALISEPGDAGENADRRTRTSVELVVRKLRHGGLFAPWLGADFWGPGRVLRELSATRELFAAGAPVPQPALALARRRAGPLWECAIGTQRAEGITLLAALHAVTSADARAAALRACAEAVRAFHDRGGRHADLNAANVLVAAPGPDARACLIDLDRARVASPVPAHRRAREIARLWRSLAKHGGAARIDANERAAFLAAYCSADAALERALRTHLPRERLRTALHAWRYPQR